MNDRELLELAAKAAGMDGGYVEHFGEVGIARKHTGIWNPLEYDGDALRLAVKLGIRVTPYPIHTFPKHSVIASQRQVAPADDDDNTWIGPEVIEVYGEDPCAATRCAIVRAAAEIGKEM